MRPGWVSLKPFTAAHSREIKNYFKATYGNCASATAMDSGFPTSVNLSPE